MRICSMSLIVALVLTFSSSTIAQRGQRAGTARANAASSALPFDPHDLSGVWNRSAGDRGMSARPGQNVPPMTPEGQEKFNASRPGYGPRAVPPATGNDIVGDCNPQGLPRILFFPRPFEFIQTNGRLLQFFQWHRVLREIWADGRELPKDPKDLDYLPRWYGYSAGKWEGDTFVVNSFDFDERTWLDQYGYPHSNAMRLQERYRRVDHDTLELKITVDDPKTYTKPWVSETKMFKLEPKYELLEEICAPVDEVDEFNKRVRNPAGGVTNK